MSDAQKPIDRPTDGRRREYRVGHELVDEFLEFASGRARPNTVRAYAHDRSVFFGVIRKEPKDVTCGCRKLQLDC
jgi:hypothetical protein